MAYRKILSIVVLVALGAVPACSGGDDNTGPTVEQPGVSSPLGRDVPSPTVDTCTFAPPEPGIIGLGTVTLTGRNDTGQLLDSTIVDFDLLNASGQKTAASLAALTAWRDGESISLETAPFGDPTAGEPVSCKVTEVRASFTAHDKDLPIDAVTCTIGQAAGPIGGPPFTVDVSGVERMPSGTDTLVTVALVENGKRVGERPVTVKTGQTTADGSLIAERPGLTCEPVLATAI